MQGHFVQNHFLKQSPFFFVEMGIKVFQQQYKHLSRVCRVCVCVCVRARACVVSLSLCVCVCDPFQGGLGMQSNFRFWKTLLIVALCSKCNRALTFQNFGVACSHVCLSGTWTGLMSQGKRTPSLYLHIREHILYATYGWCLWGNGAGLMSQGICKRTLSFLFYTAEHILYYTYVFLGQCSWGWE